MDDAREAYSHEGEPRIVASGRWEQDEFGDTTYIPDHTRPSTAGNSALCAEAAAPDDAGRGHDHEAPEARDGYRVRSEAIWAAARRDYLAGDAAEAVCARYDLKLGTLRARAAREGWRRSDVEDPLPDDPEPALASPPDPVGEADLDRLAADVLARAQRAVARGRAGEAATWLRVHRQLTRLMPAPCAPPPEPRPAPAPDPLALLNLKMKAVGEVARAAAALDPDNTSAQAAIGALLAELRDLPRVEGEPPISDDSDDSDPESPDPALVEAVAPDD